MATEFCRYCVSIMQGPVCRSKAEARKCPCWETEQRMKHEEKERQQNLLKTLGVKPTETR